MVGVVGDEIGEVDEKALMIRHKGLSVGKNVRLRLALKIPYKFFEFLQRNVPAGPMRLVT